MQARGLDDTLQFADKFRNYSKEDGQYYRNLNNKKFVLRRKNKEYCSNCKTKNNLNSIYCKECGADLESISKRTYDFSIGNVISNINIKDSFKVAGFATLILLAVSLVLKQILGITLGNYISYVSVFDVLLLANGGSLSIFTNANGMMNYGSSYNFTIQICALILLVLPVICMTVSYRLFIRQKNSDELVLFRQAIGVGIVYGVILTVLAFLSRNSLSVGNGYLSSGYSLIYGVNFISVLFRGILLGFLSILYIGINKEYRENNMYLDIFKQVVNTVLLGYLIVFVLLALGYFIGLSYVYEFGISGSISNINIFVVISQLAAYIWGFANLNFVTIGSQNMFLPNLFSTSISMDFKLCLVAFVALSSLILFISGMKLNNKYKNKAKKITLIFSVFYAIIMGVLAIFTYVNVNGGSLLGFNIQMNMSMIFTIITSFIYSFVVTFIGFKLNNWD
ncbi:hypothetical protein [Intestinibacter sp.]